MMSITEQLSSQIGDRSEESNRNVAIQCREDPSLLKEIAVGLQSKDAALIGDCAEVRTMVSETHPHYVSHYADVLITLFSHKKPRVRWEAMHALSK